MGETGQTGDRSPRAEGCALVRGEGRWADPGRHGIEVVRRLSSPVVATLGNFDGVHLGHQALLGAVRAAKGASGSAVAVTFSPHPSRVVSGGSAPVIPALTRLRERVALLSANGIDLVYLIHFTPAFSELSAQEFVDRVLCDTLRINRLVIGPDAHVGKGRQGSPEVLTSLLASRDVGVEIVEFLHHGGARVSSRVVRSAISQGDMQGAALLLGRPYSVRGRVVRGAGRGSLIGVPTANLLFPSTQNPSGGIETRVLLPARGVYCGYARVRGERYPGVANIGIRPTFGGTSLSVEVHLMEFSGGDLYGEEMTFEWIARLRDERRFSGVEELTAQIRDDIARAREIVALPRERS